MAFELKHLEELEISLIDGDRGKKYPKQSDFTCEGDCLFLSAKNVTKTGFEFEQLAFISFEKDAELRAGKIQVGDVIITTRGTIGNVAYYGESCQFKHVRINSGMIIVRANERRWNTKFLYFVLTSEIVKQQIDALTSGSAVPQFPARDIRKLLLPDVDKTIQDSIDIQLTALNEKITLNRRINQTLEQIAQALFKSWFVDFDPVVDNALDAGFFEQDLEFSDELLRRAEARKAVRENADFKPLPENIRQIFPAAFEECSEPSLGLGGWMPGGWVYDCFSELLSSTIGGDWGKDSQDEKHTTQSRIVRGTDIPDLISGQLSNAPLRWVDPKKLQSRQIEAGDIIIEVSGGSPTQSTGRSIFMTQSMLNRLGGVVEPASFCRRFKPKSFCLGILASLHLQAIYSDGKMWEYQNQSTGIANFQTKFFLEAERVLMPSDKVLENFCQIVTPLIEKSQNSEQVALAKLRDTLLPKLISGELEVDTAEEVLA